MHTIAYAYSHTLNKWNFKKNPMVCNAREITRNSSDLVGGRVGRKWRVIRVCAIRKPGKPLRTHGYCLCVMFEQCAEHRRKLAQKGCGCGSPLWVTADNMSGITITETQILANVISWARLCPQPKFHFRGNTKVFIFALKIENFSR